MNKLSGIIKFVSGSPQFRITENMDKHSPIYSIYSQTDLQDDLVGIDSIDVYNKKIRTWDRVNTVETSDVIFSLISGNAVIVRQEHDGYLYTQNYIKLIPEKNIDPQFLVYYLNENKKVRRQFQLGLQGSAVMKYTLKQLKEIEIPSLPPLSKQKIIGELYFKQLRVQALQNRVANLETTILLYKLEGEMQK